MDVHRRRRRPAVRPGRQTLLFAVASWAAALTPALSAQEADPPPTRAAGSPVLQAEPTPAWRTQLELGFNGARGNSSFVVLRTGFSVKHLRTETAEIELSGLYRYGKSDDQVIARDWRAGVKLDLVPQGMWSPFLFASASADRVRRLDLRSEGGAGAKYTFWTGETGQASISAASLYSYESFRQDPALPPLDPSRSMRWSVRTKGEKRIGQTEFQQTTFYQPVWDQVGDFFIEATTAVATRLVGDLNLAIEHEYLHDASPPPDVVRSDHKLSVVFRYLF